MKPNKQILLTIATALLALASVNCGGGGGGSSSSTTAALGASCGTNMLQSQYGCLPQCGPTSVYYQNQCMPVTGAGYGQYPGSTYPGQQYPGSTYPGSTYPGQTGGNPAMCAGMCAQYGGQYVQVQGQCLPQGTCQACYGQSQQYCYMGDYAHQYYGY